MTPVLALILALAAQAAAPPDPSEPGDQYLQLLDAEVLIEKTDGTLASGKLVAVSPTTLTVRLKDLRLLELQRSDVASVSAAAAPSAPDKVHPPKPAPPTRAIVDSGRADRRRAAKADEVRVARRKLELAEKELVDAEGQAMNWTVGAAAGAALGCAMCGMWGFVLAFPAFLIGGGVGIVAGAVTGIVAAVQWADVGTKRAVVDRRRESLRDASDSMAY